MYKTTVSILAVLALTSVTDAQFCSDCKWGVNKVVSYVQNQGNSDVCHAVLGEVDSYMLGACIGPCATLVNNMCQDVLQQIESDAGQALSADHIDATSICTTVGACGSADDDDDTASDNTASDDTASDNTASDNTASDDTASDDTASDGTASDNTASDDTASDDDNTRRNRRSSSSWVASACSRECANFPNPTQCQQSCVSMMPGGSIQLRAILNHKMQDDARRSPTITLSTGETGHCVKDAVSAQFLCAVDHPSATSLAAGQSSSSSSSKGLSSGATAGIIVGAVAAVLVIVGVAWRATVENKQSAAPTTVTEPLVEEEQYASA